MTINQRGDYDDGTPGQGSKQSSPEQAKRLVEAVRIAIAPNLKQCYVFEGEDRLGGAPAVRLPNGKLAIAPDIKCVTHHNKVFWLEVKDKAQRFYYPDTGADLFQVYGWYGINRSHKEPVFVVFKDPSFEACLPKKGSSPKLVDEFRPRWNRFNGNYYGGWLSDLLNLDGRYPRCFEERSRLNRMYILYFPIQAMTSIASWQAIIEAVDSGVIAPVQDAFRVFENSTGQLLVEDEMRGLLASLWRST